MLWACPKLLSRVWLFANLCTVACQAPLSMAFSRQECWSGLLFPPLEDLPNPGIEATSLMSPALAGRFFTTRASEALINDAPVPEIFNLGSLLDFSKKIPKFTLS